MSDITKIVEELSKLSVLEAAELVKALEEKWGVSAAAPVAVAAGPVAAAAAEAVEEKTEFDVVLKGREPQSVIQQCGSGVTACHNLLAMEVAGLSGSRLYVGSWSEWCADPSRPMVTAAASA